MNQRPVSSVCLDNCLLTAALALALGGCTLGPDFKPPAPPVSEGYTAPHAGDAAPGTQHVRLGAQIEGDWWSLFQSSALDGVVHEAIAHNSSLEASAAAVARAQELAKAQAAQLWPQVALTAGVGRQKYGDEFLGGVFNLPPFTYFAVGPVVSYTLDYNGGLARGVEAQKAMAEVSHQQLNAAYLTVSGQAVVQMLLVASVRSQIDTVETILDQDEQNLSLVRTAFQAGSVSKIDVVSAESQLASDRSLLPALHQDLARGHHALSVLMGRTPTEALPADLDLAALVLPAELPVALPSELAHRRPDILAAEARLHAATSAVGVATANLYPRIQLTGTVGFQSNHAAELFDGSSLAWSALSGLTLPLIDGGALRAEKRAALEAMKASASSYRQTVLEAFAQVADLLDALSHDAEELAAQTEAQDAAQRNLDLARLAYREGNTGILQVLDAERQSQRSRLGYVRAVGQRYIDTAQLFLALGGMAPLAPQLAAGRRQRVANPADE